MNRAPAVFAAMLATVTSVARPQAIVPHYTASADIVVIGQTPMVGSGIDRDKVPAETHVLNAADLSRQGAPDVLGALSDQVPGLHLNDSSGNSDQSALFYHGFEASPLQGTAEGIAVYVNGVRFNQAFGDTVNWDLIPNAAIRKLEIESSNPAFGLNALGGSIGVQLQSGFVYHGGEADLSGGSFGQVASDVQYGWQSGSRSAYVAASVRHRDGWRDLQSSDVQNLFGDLGWRGDRIEAHVTLTFANSVLNGPGTSPVELLTADPRAQFTGPNQVANRYVQATGSAKYDTGAATSLQANVYYSRFRQRVVNGNAPSDTPCNDGSGLLCDSNGNPSTTLGGRLISDFLGGSQYGELDQQATDTDSYGATVQVTDADAVLGLGNHLVGGLSFDGATTRFSAKGTIGGLARNRVFVGPGVTIDELGQNRPARLAVVDAYNGVFLSDTLDLTDRLTLSASGRFNLARVDLQDEGDGDLSGKHRYSRFNPAVGAAFRVTSWLTAYAGYKEGNRAPTPAELSCASPADSCSLANFFTGDPDLKQVVTRTIEAGLRGTKALGAGTLTYSLSIYRAALDDDIAFVNVATLAHAFFRNVGQTQRQGLDAGLKLHSKRWLAYFDYSRIEATYRSRFTEAAGSNPGGDASGELTIVPGNRLPGIPRNLVKFGGDFSATRKWSIGAVGLAQSGTILFGDPSNLTPLLQAFFHLDLDTKYQITPHVQFFARLVNATGARYYTFGTFSPTSSVFLAQAPGATNPRAYSAAAPTGGFGGLKITF